MRVDITMIQSQKPQQGGVPPTPFSVLIYEIINYHQIALVVYMGVYIINLIYILIIINMLDN